MPSSGFSPLGIGLRCGSSSGAADFLIESLRTSERGKCDRRHV